MEGAAEVVVVDAVDATMTEEEEDVGMEVEVEGTETEEGTGAEMIVTAVEDAISTADMKAVGAGGVATMMGAAVDIVVLREAEATSGRSQRLIYLTQKQKHA